MIDIFHGRRLNTWRIYFGRLQLVQNAPEDWKLALLLGAIWTLQGCECNRTGGTQFSTLNLRTPSNAKLDSPKKASSVWDAWRVLLDWDFDSRLILEIARQTHVWIRKRCTSCHACRPEVDPRQSTLYEYESEVQLLTNESTHLLRAINNEGTHVWKAASAQPSS